MRSGKTETGEDGNRFVYHHTGVNQDLLELGGWSCAVFRG
jgi:hypothetical protein